MEQVHSRALEALQPFVHLATTTASPSPRFVTNLITNATSSPNTYVFGELLETPAVQSLASSETPEEYQGYLPLLQIFAWGTWEEYKTTPNLPALNDEQAQKLRLLSLLTLSTAHNPLTYSTAIKSLYLESHSDLETLVTQAIYSALITARLSPTTSPPVVRVTAVAPLRDVRPQTASTMISVLSEWQGRCQQVVDGIEQEITNIRADVQKKQAREKERVSLLEESLSSRDKDDTGGGGAGSGGSASGFKRQLRFLREGSGGGGGGGGGGKGRRPPTGGVSSGSKRGFNATKESPMPDPNNPYMDTFGMDLSEGPGRGAGPRHSKRVLGMDHR